ncbi:MAG: hypothetical protein KJS91_00845 [Planctomycetes bacterium]|jgi:hypothetical protein|nr:hypothetical protein [Planctomycetota bacterium]
MIRMTMGAAAMMLLAALTVRADDSRSRWKGQWTSDSTGHKGPLRATVVQEGPDSYKARFAGRFAGVVPFMYTSKMQVTGVENGRVHLAADRKLPMFGQFSTRAVIDGDRFDATFKAKNDQGSFRMERR